MASVRSALFLLGVSSAVLLGCARGPVSEYEADAEPSATPPDTIDAGEGADAAAPAEEDAAGRRDAGRRPFDAALPLGNGGADSGPSGTPADAASGQADAGVDAGGEVDTGTSPPPPEDAGSAPVDSGPAPEPDTGPPPAPTPRCVPGTYTGVFEGEISALLGFVRIDISGTITLQLALTTTGDRLDVVDGTLQGTDQDANPITARVSGSLSCETKQLENGRITDGTYMRVDPIFGGPPMTVAFTGTATATYFEDPPSAQGRWDVQNETGLRGGSGTWTARLQN